MDAAIDTEGNSEMLPRPQLTEAGKRRPPPHQDLRLDTNTAQPAIGNDHPIVKHVVRTRDGRSDCSESASCLTIANSPRMLSFLRTTHL